jgi:DNA-binding CsgD family transcriptional regulator
MGPMDNRAIARLTNQQRLCLRYVYAHLTSKEIAPLVGLQPASVDQYIKIAMRTLGVQDRRSAAILLAEYEKSDPVRQMEYQLPDIADHPRAEEAELSNEREPQASFQSATVPRSTASSLLGGVVRPGDLDWRARLMWIGGIAIGMALAFGVLVSAVDALARLLGR